MASVAAIALLSGCSTLSSLNPFASKAPPKAPPAALVEFRPTLAVRPAWSTSIGSAGNYVFSPAAVGGNVFAASADGSLARFELASGRQFWRINAGMKLTAGVGSDGTTVAVAGSDGAVLAFDAEGKQRWKAQASSEILSAPAVGGGLVIVRSVDNRISAFDAESGDRRWSIQRPAPSLTLRSAPGIAISGPSAYVAMPGGRLLAIALSNGGPRWEAAVGDPRGATELERVADVSGMPAVIGREVCAVAYQGRVACFDAATGVVRWAKAFSSDAGLAVDERFVFSSSDRGIVDAFARESGASAWRNTSLANRSLAAPVSFGRAVAVGDAQGFVHFLSREDGSFIARAALDNSPVIGIPAQAGNALIFQTKAGTLAALAAE